MRLSISACFVSLQERLGFLICLKVHGTCLVTLTDILRDDLTGLQLFLLLVGQLQVTDNILADRIGFQYSLTVLTALQAELHRHGGNNAVIQLVTDLHQGSGLAVQQLLLNFLGHRPHIDVDTLKILFAQFSFVE